MIKLHPHQLMLGSIAVSEHVTGNPAAWRSLAEAGLVKTRPAEPGRDLPVIVSLTEAGRAALEEAKNRPPG